MSVYEEFQQELFTTEYEEMEFKIFEKIWIDKISATIPPEFGIDMKHAFFPYLQSNYLAHGSYGAASLLAIKVSQDWQNEMECNPSDFYHNVLFDYLVRSIRHLSTYLDNTNPMDLMLVKNVEVGLQSVLRSFPEHSNFLCFEISYGAVKTSLEAIAKKNGHHLYQIPLSFPISKDSIINDLGIFLDKDISVSKSIALCVLEHISSPTAILFPIKELSAILKKHNIAVLVDGAHAIGQIELSLDDLKVDFYTSNLHKWFCSPRGCAFLFVSSKYHECISPLLISWGWKYPIQSKFIWQGTDDCSAYLTIPLMIKFLKWLPNPMKRNHEIADWCGRMLSSIWKTEQLVPENMIGSMAVVQIPECYEDCSDKEYAALIYQVKKVHRIEVPSFEFRGKRWIRVSIHIYNTKEECLNLADIMLKVLRYPLKEIQERLGMWL